MCIPARVLSVLVLSCVTATALPADQIVEGRVLNETTGAAVANVQVHLLPLADSPSAPEYTAITDPNGRFRIEGVADGAYRARYRVAGYSPLPDQGRVLPPFSVVSGTEPVHLEAKMKPLTRLTGRILDPDGRPFPKAGVWLIQGRRWCLPPSCFADRRATYANDQGEYAIDDIAPGPWIIAAAPPPDTKPPGSQGDVRLAWVQTFYPGLTDSELAQPVTVMALHEQWNPDLKIKTVPAHSIGGKVLDSAGKPVPNVTVNLEKGFGPGLKQETREGGTFEFAAVVAGEWRLSAKVDKLRATQIVSLKDRDAENIDLRLQPSFTLRGKLVMEGSGNEPRVDLLLVPDSILLSDTGSAFIPVEVDNEGLTARGVYPGTYQIQQLSDPPLPFYLDTIRLGERDATGTVAINSGAEPLTITYKLGGGTVRGTIEACGIRGAFLIPVEARLRRAAFIRSSPCDANGNFEFTAVRPGEYYGLAVEPGPGVIQAVIEDSLLEKAARLTVRPRESLAAQIPVLAR